MPGRDDSLTGCGCDRLLPFKGTDSALSIRLTAWQGQRRYSGVKFVACDLMEESLPDFLLSLIHPFPGWSDIFFDALATLENEPSTISAEVLVGV